MCRVHESLKVKYTNTLFDSRCILFASSTQSNKVDSDDLNQITNDKCNDNTQDVISDTDASKKLRNSYTTPLNFKSNVTFYAENSPCSDLETIISDYISSLFWILEKKRLDRLNEKFDKFPLLLAPFEKKDFVGLDMDTRNMRKRCVGRVTKNLADLTLQAGLVADSLNLFHSACETLRAISDSLWLGAANEGMTKAKKVTTN